jgi:hypothetical protein
MTETVRVSADWLTLREPADAAARAVGLVEPVRRHLAGRSRLVIHDLGTGTGSMGRWLAPLLPGPQHWVMHDRDPDLLEHAAAGMATRAADGAPVTVETREGDITRLAPTDLADAALITASALLDMFTADEVERFVAACAGAGCPSLLTLSVTGRVEFTPADPLDAEFEAAFNAHQRRTTGGRALLGPDAVGAAAEAFGRHGIGVRTEPSPWRLGPDRAALIGEWFDGWAGAAVEERPELAPRSAAYVDTRRNGTDRVLVHHSDLLAGCE